MQTNEFYKLGLSALSDKGDCHIGATILALQKSKEYLGETGLEPDFIDSQILIFAKSHHIEVLEPSGFISAAKAKEKVAQAMLKTCHKLHYIAHDLISGAYALIAINEIAGDIDNRIVNQICLNIEAFVDSPPGHFYNLSFNEIREAENNYLLPDKAPSDQELVNIAISFLKSIQITYLTWFFRSQEFHVITHTHALIWLRRNGYKNVFDSSIKPWLVRMSLLRNIIAPKDSGLVASPFESVKIGDEEFWKKVNNDSYDGHIFKTTYSILDLRYNNLLSQEDFEYLIDSKFPYLFSTEVNKEETAG